MYACVRWQAPDKGFKKRGKAGRFCVRAGVDIVDNRVVGDSDRNGVGSWYSECWMRTGESHQRLGPLACSLLSLLVVVLRSFSRTDFLSLSVCVF